jgi:hypothetical protein
VIFAEAKQPKHNVIETRCEDSRLSSVMKPPSPIAIHMILKIFDHFGLPLRWNLCVSDVHGKDKAREKEAGASVTTSPMAIVELESLIEGVAIDCGRMKVVRRI